ncbi:hypothetical protein BDU57DRAFT_349264 [Ampelomyces quisqualis]|uniref:Uncharacterized protein n=1 Tax=Ampelomyces quisqualis TaxID=50730 RepID=A0A6A5QEL3_AMPQU|nr:hypothetical protein BDU57DRAFT_349264 [Ampelomyces quisqualis]
MGYSCAADGHETSRPSSPGRKLPCRVGPPPNSRVVSWTDVPASLMHGTVLPQTDGPIPGLHRVGHAPRRQQTPYSRCKECRPRREPPTIRERREPGRRGRASLPDFSEIYSRFFRKGSLLQVSNATVVLENGHGLSSAIRMICFGAEILIQHPNNTHEAILAW